MRVLDLFSGIGGFSLGLERAGMKTVAFCEIDKYCQKVLKRHWPNLPIFDDVKKIKGELIRDSVDLVSGGFPCQDISVGGKQRGITGNKSGLWKEYWRLIDEIKPRYAIIENVERLRKNGLGIVLNDLSKIGYDAEWHCITAASIGLPHQRDRLWLVSYPSGERPHEHTGKKRQIRANQKWEGAEIHKNREQRQLKPGEICTILSRRAIEITKSANADQFAAVSGIRRVVNGLPEGLYESERKRRIKQLGNSVVPQIAEMIGKQIMEYEANANRP